MRAGICSVQQALTPEAVNIVKQAVSLATRRGHAQVTPLHVASSMLASSASLLRRACLQSHSHPLQCKALELCFNVALNRLPASSSSPLLGPHSPLPSLSNALVAAFKRAQAHQRRGSIENQQQPILALKIELEQLIISILDDPSVSRVMREAGFSSTQVKNNVEQAVSLAVSPQSPGTKHPNMSHSPSYTHLRNMTMARGKPSDQVKNDRDHVTSIIINTLARKKRNTVIVGDYLSSSEDIVKGVMDRFEKGHVPGDLRYVQFISLPLVSLRNLSKEEVEQKLAKLRRLVKCYIGRGVILYLGDLKWVSEIWSCDQQRRNNWYCPVELIIMELKRLVDGGSGEHEEGVWLMGIATFQTYMRCKTGQPSLGTMWELHPVTIPLDNLSLSLNLESDSQSQYGSRVSYKDGCCWPVQETSDDKQLITGADTSIIYFNREAAKSSTHENKDTSTSLPSWLQQYKEDTRRNPIDNQECVNVVDVCKKWNSFSSSSNKHPQNTVDKKVINFSSPSPSSSASVSSHEHASNLNQTDHISWPAILKLKVEKVRPKEHQFWISENDEGVESHLRSYHGHEHNKPELLSNPNSSPNSASSSEAIEEDTDGLNMFKELNSHNLNILCNALEKKVPQHKEIIPELVRTILQCRSGMKIKKSSELKQYRQEKEETWLFFLGGDCEVKEAVARELARLIFGSQSSFLSISMTHYSIQESSKKRRQEMDSKCYVEKLGEALNENPHRVFFMEDMDQIDSFSQKGIKQTIKSGNITLSGGETVPLKDAIVIFSCESFSSESIPPCSPSTRQKKTSENEEKEDKNNQGLVSLDLNISIEDNTSSDESSDEDIGILDCVDRQIVFNSQEV